MNQSRPLIILSHVIGWILFLSLIIGFISTFNNSDISALLLSPYFLLFVFVYAFLFYFNSSFLFRELYLKKRYAAYFIIIAGFLIAIYFLQPFDHLISGNRGMLNAERNMNMPPPSRHPPGPAPQDMKRPFPPPPGQLHRGPGTDIISIILFLMVLSFSSALLILKQWRLTEQRAAQAETEKANAELSFLKAQINPHFLFNTLNNIYSMAVTKNEATPDSIMKLSQIMRYVTDEVTQELVPLQSEADCASDYIALQKLRLSKKVKLEFCISGNTDGKQIPPLILMPFIENAFKYGISSHELSTVIIKISANKNAVYFFCQNNIFNNLHVEQSTGIGITNTKKRLEHHYHKKHVLNITNADGLYTVQLTLPA